MERAVYYLFFKLYADIYKINDQEKKVLTINDEEKVLKKLDNTPSSFIFTRIFDEESTQEEVYSNSCQKQAKLLIRELESSLIFTYGITNAGKTFTIIGIL